MPKLSWFRTTAGVFAAAAVLATATPSAAATKAVVITPEKMIPVNRTQDHQQIAAWVGAMGPTPVVFWAPLKLPLGAKITGLVYYHWSDGAEMTSAVVTRAKVGASYSAADVIYSNLSTAAASLFGPPVVMTTTTPDNPSSDTVVRPGYRYFVFAGSGAVNAIVGGVKVLYQD